MSERRWRRAFVTSFLTITCLSCPIANQPFPHNPMKPMNKILLRCLALAALFLSMFDSRVQASTQVVPPNPDGGRQARAPGQLGVGGYSAFLGGWVVTGLDVRGYQAYLEFTPQWVWANDPMRGFVFASGFVAFGFDTGYGYSEFGHYNARVVSSTGHGAYFWVANSLWPEYFTGLGALFCGDPGTLYGDDATIVIDPPHMNDFQGALDNTNVTVIQLQSGTYFQNAVINRDLTIRGEGMGRTIVSGAMLGSVFRILPGKTVVLEDMTIVEGLAPSG